MGLLTFIKPTTLTFEKRKQVIGNAYSFTFKAANPLSWYAGQHGMLEIKLPNGSTARKMFSLSSAPTENKVTITTYWKGESASNYKRALWNLKPGDSAKIRGPVGPMYIRDETASNIFLAGGIGITPFRSIIMEAKLKGKNLHATLLYANKDAENVIFKNELNQLADQLENISINYMFDPAKITSEDITNASAAGAHASAHYYLSGPPQMIKQYKQILRQLGVPKKQIYSDPFMGYK